MPYLDQDLCTYSCTINIVKDGDEEKTMGYPGKEDGQIHLKMATIGIGDDELRNAIEVNRATRPRHARVSRVTRPLRACVRPPCADGGFALRV